MLILSLFHKLQKCTLNLGIFWYSSWMFFAPMLAWETFPGPRNNVYKNILGNALLPLKLFHIKPVNTRLIFSQVTQKGPIYSFCFLKNLQANFSKVFSKKGAEFPIQMVNFFAFSKRGRMLAQWPNFWDLQAGNSR